MPTTRLFAYNTGSPISGTTQVGSIAISESTLLNYSQNAGGVRWWNGPDEDLGYVITHTTPSGTQPNRDGVAAYIGFWRSSSKTENSLISLTNSLFRQNFTSGSDCKTYLNNNGYWVSWVGSSVDPDAQAFITAANITDPTQQSAINTLVVGLKTDGLWTKMMAIYPFVGGTATSHKYNLKDPRDLDVAYRLTFGGGWGHSSFGIGGNGANTYADTYIVNYNLGQIGVYSNAGNNAYYGGRYGLDYQYDSVYMFPYIGAIVENSYAVSYFSNSTDGGDAMVGFGGYNLGLTTIAGGDGTAKFYVNGSLNVAITPSANPSQLPISLWFGSPHLGYNMANPSYDFYSDGTFAFGFVSSSILNSTENANLYSRVQTYQTTLGRQV
jgi:hypothetical protein